MWARMMKLKPEPPFMIGVAGGSCSGKTTLVTWLHTHLGKGESVIVSQDNYYLNRADLRNNLDDVNFDHPRSLDFKRLALDLAALGAGKTVAMPSYDFATHSRRPEPVIVDTAPIILMDGILILSDAADVRQFFDLTIYVQCPEDLRFARRLERDTRERGRTEESVYGQFYEQVAPMHEQFVSPSQAHADIVLSQRDYMAEVSGDRTTLLPHISKLMREKAGD